MKMLNKIPKVLNKNYFNLDKIFNYCELNKVKKIGFTPWGRCKLPQK